MSKIVSISISKREELGSANARRIRRSGMIPAVVYGHGEAALPIVVSPEDAGKVAYYNGLVELNCTCGTKKMAVVKEVQRHPINPGILHIDFQEVAMDEVIISTVPVNLMGEAIGTKQGGQLEQIMKEIDVKSLPANVPAVIDVDITDLGLDAAIHVGDLALPEGVEAASDADLVVCLVRGSRDAAAAEETAEEEK